METLENIDKIKKIFKEAQEVNLGFSFPPMVQTEKMKKFAIQKHQDVNQMYGKYPYTFHLNMVYRFVLRFSHLINKEDLDKAGAAAWGHDLIEDTRTPYNEIKQNFNEDIAELIFLCTELRGRTREERHGDKFYEDLSKNRLAVFVKLCDNCANYYHSSKIKHDMYMKYKKELPNLKEKLFKKNEYEEIWKFLKSL